MYFQQKLRILTTLFKLSNSKLARGINVDASLVSRWKSGERKISQNSPHIPALATYFLRLNAYQYQKAYLDRIIDSHLPEADKSDEARRIHVLADWLISEEPPEQPVQSEQASQLSNSAALIANMADLLSVNGQPRFPAAPETGFEPGNMETETTPPAGDMTCESLVFQGRQGRRRSVLMFLRQILASGNKKELLLISEDDMAWLLEDPGFTREWALLLKQVIETGHKVTIIHVVNRRAGEIMNVLNYWMPLHLAGHIDSYYYPLYIEREIRQTMFIVRDELALISTTTAEFNENELTYLFRDEISVNGYARIYDYFLKECRPLFSVYSRQQAADFYKNILDIRGKGGSVYNIRHTLNLMALSDEDQAGLAAELDLGIDPDTLRQWFRMHQATFNEQLKHNWYVDILPYSLLDQISRRRQAWLPRNEIFSAGSFYLSPETTIAWLQNTIRLLKENDNYQVCFAPVTPGLDSIKVNINYKENIFALFSTELPEGKAPLTVMLSEANILHALSHFLDDFIQKIPSSLRRKEEVIDRLQKLIFNLEHDRNPLQK